MAQNSTYTYVVYFGFLFEEEEFLKFYIFRSLLPLFGFPMHLYVMYFSPLKRFAS